MGKTENGAIWLDASRTSPYTFYQYWFNVSDADVLLCLRFLTEIDQSEYSELEKAVNEDPGQRAAQRRLAGWLTEFIHGSSGLQSAIRATEYLFGAEISDLSDQQLLEIFHDVPSGTVTSDELSAGLPIIDAPVRVGLCKSKSESRRSLEQGGIYINNRRVDSIDRLLTPADLASQSALVIRVGKKRFAVLKVVD
jgi:tyrosyl-tRNA synthetase